MAKLVHLGGKRIAPFVIVDREPTVERYASVMDPLEFFHQYALRASEMIFTH